MEGGHRIPGWKDSPGHWILEYSDRGRSPTRGDPPTTVQPTNTCGAAQVSDYECAHLDMNVSVLSMRHPESVPELLAYT